MTGRTSHLCLPVFGSILRQLSPGGDGDASLYLISLIILVRKGLVFPCGLIKSPRARLSLARTWGPVPLSELISRWARGTRASHRPGLRHVPTAGANQCH